MTMKHDAAYQAAPLAYRIRVAEKISGISKSKLYQLASAGKLNLCRVGGRTLVPHDELHRLINEGRSATVHREEGQ